MNDALPPVALLRGGELAVARALADALGWSTSAEPETVDRGAVVVHPITDHRSMALSVTAVAAGAGLLADVSALEDPLYVVLCDDLRRLGRRVRHVSADDHLELEAVALLDLLAAGWTLGDAATALHLSRRSGDRRLARAREVLGAATTAEAVAQTRATALCRPAPRSGRARLPSR